jgi:hypothetical protein
MYRTIALAGFLGFTGVLAALPVDCTSLTNLQQYLNQSALGGCIVQDKLFTNFTYTGGGAETASKVNVLATLSVLPDIDVHGFTFTPASVWTTGFTLGYTISVHPPSAGVAIFAVSDQINLGPLVNATTAVSTKSNGVVFNLSQANSTLSATFADVASLSSSTRVTIPRNGYLISLGEQYVEMQIPEPVTWSVAGLGLLGLLGFRRIRRAR